MLGKIIVSSVFVAILLLIMLLETTTPSSIGPVGLLGVFFLLYVVALGCVTEVIWVGSKVVYWVRKRLMTKQPPTILSLQKAYYYSTVLALGPIMMIAMKSIGSLGRYEVVLIVLFMGVGTLYISKRTSV